VQDLVESYYVNGRPRHHLPAARNPTYTPDSSVFFIVDFPDFAKLSGPTIHVIARRRHIAVTNVPQEEYLWTRETLSKFGSLSALRDIQGKFFKSSHAVDSPPHHSWAMSRR
jgi:hypothetical protein